MASTIVAQFSWDDIASADFGNPVRKAWREAVAEVAEKAKATLPECNGRVDSAVKIVLAGDVELQPDGKAKVASQSNGSTVYHVVNGECTCKDYSKAPSNWCKHRIAAGIAKRAYALAKQRLDQLDSQTSQNGTSQPTTEQSPIGQPASEASAPALPLPEAPASVNCHILLEGRQVQVTLRDTDEARLLTRLAALLRQYPTAQPPTQPPAQGTTQPTGDESPYCHVHRVALQRFSKDGRTWYSHKAPDGFWCKGK
jgi:hypothetical protein